MCSNVCSVVGGSVRCLVGGSVSVCAGLVWCLCVGLAHVSSGLRGALFRLGVVWYWGTGSPESLREVPLWPF